MYLRMRDDYEGPSASLTGDTLFLGNYLLTCTDAWLPQVRRGNQAEVWQFLSPTTQEETQKTLIYHRKIWKWRSEAAQVFPPTARLGKHGGREQMTRSSARNTEARQTKLPNRPELLNVSVATGTKTSHLGNEKPRGVTSGARRVSTKEDKTLARLLHS